MDKYQIVKQIGEGTFGVVLKAINKETNETVAIKRMKKKASWDDVTKMSEVKALKHLNSHPNIIKIKELSLKDDLLNIVFEFCDKNLYQEMQTKAQKNQRYNEAEIRDVMLQAL